MLGKDASFRNLSLLFSSRTPPILKVSIKYFFFLIETNYPVLIRGLGESQVTVVAINGFVISSSFPIVGKVGLAVVLSGLFVSAGIVAAKFFISLRVFPLKSSNSTTGLNPYQVLNFHYGSDPCQILQTHNSPLNVGSFSESDYFSPDTIFFGGVLFR